MLIWCSFIAKWAMQFGNHVLLNTRWRFGVIFLLSLRGQFGNIVLLNIHWQFGDTLITKHTLAILATSYGLNRNDRVSSFYKTRGSKLCFLTCFSYFSRYFLILVFCKIAISLHLSQLHGNPISYPIFVPLALWVGTSYMRPHVSGTECVGFSKQDAHGNLVVDSLPVNFPLSAFHRRFLVQTLIGQMQMIPFILTKKPGTDLSCVT
jgi:hypothetical protein